MKKDVLNDHKLYERNKSNADIVYPSIEKKEYAKHIFEFINAVRKSPINNGLFDFQFSRDIEELLKKQWAGMFYEFLLDRTNKAKLGSANQTLSQLNTMSKKIEELVENIYRKVDEARAETVIETIDKKAEALSFFEDIGKRIGHSLLSTDDIDEVMKIPINQAWYNWMANVFGFRIRNNVRDENNKTYTILVHFETARIIARIDGDLSDKHRKENEEYKSKFESFKTLEKGERQKILESFAIPF